MKAPFSATLLQRTVQQSRLPYQAAVGNTQPHQVFRSGSHYKMSSAPDVNVENTNNKTAPGVTLDEQQKTLVGSVLDLFAGRPSLKKLRLWEDTATFEDPITIAQGRKQYEPQWYGLQAVFSQIERLHHEVKSAGNPIVLDMRSRYVVKGINKEQVIESEVEISYDKVTGKIVKVADKWNGKLPDSSFKDALRNLNSVTVPLMVSVPKDDAEDAARGNQ